MYLGVVLTMSNVPARLAHSRSAVSEVNVCGAKSSRNPIGMSSKTCKIHVSFYFLHFQNFTNVGFFCFVLFLFSLATACFNFYLKHYSIPLVHENLELRWARNRWASLGVVQYCRMDCCVDR